MYQIIFYKDENGRSEVEEYIKEILLTHFIKSTKKTPRREIKRAYKLLKIVKGEINDERKF